MKKLISVVLCIMMVSSLFAMNVSASIVTGANQVYLVNDDFEGTTLDDFTFVNATESDDGSYIYSQSYRAYAQPVAFPDDHAYSIQFDTKFQNLNGDTVLADFYVLDKNAVPNIAGSFDFTIRGDINPEAKGIDVSKWYTFRITIDKSAISQFAYYCRLYGDGIKVEWKEQGTGEWKTATNGYNLEENEANFGGEDLKYTVSYISNSWQWTNADDMNSDGFGFGSNKYLSNFKVNYGDVSIPGAKLGEDAYGNYIYSDQYSRPYIQPISLPENGAYTIEFDSKFSSTADGTARGIYVYLLDLNLVETVNNPALTSSLDFEIYGNQGSEIKGIDTNKWYSFKITVDASKGLNYNGFYGRIFGDGIVLQWKERGADTWKTAQTNASKADFTNETDLWYVVSRNYWQYVNGTDKVTPGFGFQTQQFLDNLVISYSEPIPTTGVLYVDDFEGATQLTSGMGSIATAGGNSYLKLYSTSNGSTPGEAAATEIPENFIVTMDVYKEADCDSTLTFEYWQTNVNDGGTWGRVGISADAVEAGKWYTLKIAKIAADRTYTVTLEDAEGNVTTPVMLNNAVQWTGNNPGHFTFRTLNGTVCNWRVDNILITKAAAASLTSINAADGIVAMTVSADAISDTITPVLALYSGSRLVDVDWDTKANSTEGISADLQANGSYDEAKLFVWDGFENGTPLMATPWDITEIIVAD